MIFAFHLSPLIWFDLIEVLRYWNRLRLSIFSRERETGKKKKEHWALRSRPLWQCWQPSSPSFPWPTRNSVRGQQLTAARASNSAARRSRFSLSRRHGWRGGQGGQGQQGRTREPTVVLSCKCFAWICRPRGGPRGHDTFSQGQGLTKLDRRRECGNPPHRRRPSRHKHLEVQPNEINYGITDKKNERADLLPGAVTGYYG